jgi:hypothetical protein
MTDKIPVNVVTATMAVIIGAAFAPFIVLAGMIAAGFIALVGPIAAGLFLISALVFGEARIARRKENEKEKS